MHPVAADLLFRWGVEVLTHDSWDYERAAITAQSMLRLWQLTGSSAGVERVLCEMESDPQADPQHLESYVRTDHRVNAATFEIGLDAGEMLAVHDAAEFARHAAVWSGWSFLEIRGPMSAAHSVLLLDSAARDRLPAWAVTASSPRVQELALTGWIEQQHGVVQLLDLPAWHGFGESQAFLEGEFPSLGKLLRCPALIPVSAFAVKPPCAHVIFAGNVDIASQLRAEFDELARQAGASTRMTMAAQPVGELELLATPTLMARISACAQSRRTFNPFR
ncbi:hypothetical protein [Ramlibacter albus]|uniref:Uncharacterized protein n=1 Tax=Ramlibacter albus TaxID=2079448 RepID=A0A923M514_9BURK|nr:hypothetical protein [Ramlibacter albus]MBC5763048.1 hypothetical protein [Ramlibacter albus]